MLERKHFASNAKGSPIRGLTTLVNPNTASDGGPFTDFAQMTIVSPESTDFTTAVVGGAAIGKKRVAQNLLYFQAAMPKCKLLWASADTHYALD
jgi:hypothetical protein